MPMPRRHSTTSLPPLLALLQQRCLSLSLSLSLSHTTAYRYLLASVARLSCPHTLPRTDQSSPGMSVKCLKILVLLSLIPLALRATSLLGHVMPSPSESEQSTSSSAAAAAAATGVSVSGSVHRGFNQRHRRRMESTLAAFGTTRFGRGGGDGGLGDEKRLAPTGSNPLHNLR